MKVEVRALDTTRRKYVYDDVEPRDWNQKITIPLARPDYAFSFAEVADNTFIKLQSLLGEDAFNEIVESQGYRIPKGEFETYKGDDNLPLHYYLRPDNRPHSVKLMLVSWGEYQPGRYVANFEGIYLVTGAKL